MRIKPISPLFTTDLQLKQRGTDLHHGESGIIASPVILRVLPV